MPALPLTNNNVMRMSFFCVFRSVNANHLHQFIRVKNKAMIVKGAMREPIVRFSSMRAIKLLAEAMDELGSILSHKIKWHLTAGCRMQGEREKSSLNIYLVNTLTLN